MDQNPLFDNGPMRTEEPIKIIGTKAESVIYPRDQDFELLLQEQADSLFAQNIRYEEDLQSWLNPNMD